MEATSRVERAEPGIVDVLRLDRVRSDAGMDGAVPMRSPAADGMDAATDPMNEIAPSAVSRVSTYLCRDKTGDKNNASCTYSC